MAAYAYIHCFDTDFCPFQELIQGVPSIHGVKLNSMFVRSWLVKNWLEKNELNSLSVPKALYEDIINNDFQISEMIRIKLNIQKTSKKPIFTQNKETHDKSVTNPSKRMIYMQKKNPPE
ncbi:MAG: hypothetical protein ACP5I1_16295 [Candidatus Hinthialibacter sp.]